MTYYLQEVNRIKQLCYANEYQIEKVVAIKKFLDQHYEKAINLHVLANFSFTSKFHLIRVFKRYYGLTPNQYLIRKRVREAKRLLKKGKSVSATCYAVGFESVPSFSKLFKNKTGKSPSDFKKAILNKPNS